MNAIEKQAFEKYRQERARTDALAASMGMGWRVNRMRDAATEALVARRLSGETGLGMPFIVWPIVIGAGAALTSGLNYLTEREQRIQAEINPDSQQWSDIAGDAMQWLFPAMVAGSLIIGGYLLFDTVKGSKKTGK